MIGMIHRRFKIVLSVLFCAPRCGTEGQKSCADLVRAGSQKGDFDDFMH
jgi:hypothetical protein